MEDRNDIQNFGLPLQKDQMATFNLDLPVAIGSDHAGFEFKETLISFLDGKGIACKDFGTDSTDSVDYPDFAHPVSQEVAEGKAAFGILVCGSGNGVCMTANKHVGVRAALCWGDELASLARQHNDANVLCIPARFVRIKDAELMVDTFLNTQFEGGRHEVRVNKIGC